jgi:enoyl-CoA hydratase
VEQHVARITLNQPDKRNALSPAMLLEIHDAMLEADDLVDVNVIVLDAAGKDFCAGYDLAAAYDQRSRDAEHPEPAKYRTAAGTLDDDCWNIERMQGFTTVIFDIHKPVIAKVQGNCVAGGTDLALMCDIVIAAEDAKIGFPATRANGTPSINLWFYHVGPQWAKRLLLSGDRIWGRDAAKIGLVLDAVPMDQLEEAVMSLARRLAHVDADLLGAQKRVINMAMELSGARTLQRFAGETDARAHSSSGPMRTKFKADIATQGLKAAVRARDEPFGDGMVRIHHLDGSR